MVFDTPRRNQLFRGGHSDHTVSLNCRSTPFQREGARQTVTSPAAPVGQHWNWSRREIAEWLIALAKSGRRFLAGIDHAFGFPSHLPPEVWTQDLGRVPRRLLPPLADRRPLYLRRFRA